RARKRTNAPMPTAGAGIPSEAAEPDSARIISWSIMFTGPFERMGPCHHPTAAPRHRSTRGPGGVRVTRSPSDVALPDDDPLAGGHLRQPHGPAGMELLGGDADLGPEAELGAVGEAGRGVGHHHRGVHLGE